MSDFGRGDPVCRGGPAANRKPRPPPLELHSPKPRRDGLREILIVASDPMVIGQASRFDYSGTRACKVFREDGYEVVLGELRATPTPRQRNHRRDDQGEDRRLRHGQ